MKFGAREKELTGSEARLAAIFAVEPECVKVLDQSGRILQMNPAGLSILEASSAEQVIGRSVFDFIDAADQENFRRCFDSALCSDGFSCEFQVVTALGNRRRLESHMVRLGDVPQKVEIIAVTRDITRTVAAEKAMHESELRFRQLAEHIHDVFWLLDAATERVLYVSPRYETVWGRSGKLLDSPAGWFDTVYPEDRAKVAGCVELRRSTGRFDVEYRIVRPDGTIRWVHDRAYPIFDENGVLSRIAGVATDVTERKQAENKLAHLGRLHRFSSQINDAILHRTPTHALYLEACRIAVEDGLLRMAWVGMYDPESKELRPLCSAGYVEGYLDEFTISTVRMPEAGGPGARAFLTGKPAVTPEIAEDPNFVTKKEALERDYRSCAAFPIQTTTRKLGVFVLYSSEIDFFRTQELLLLERLANNLGFATENFEAEQERQRFEDELRASEERFRLLVENSNELIGEIGDSGEMHYISPNIRNILGYEPSDLQGTNAFALLHPEDLPAILRLFEGTDGRATYRCRHANGEWRWLESSGQRFVTSAGQRRVVVISRDVTERREAAAAQTAVEAKLRQAQKMEALGALAGGIAHDFNNVLAAIIGNVELAQMDMAPNDRNREPLEQVAKAANRAAELVRQILTFSRRKDQNRTLVEGGAIVMDLVKLLRPGLSSTIEIRTSIPADLPKMVADSNQIFQVLMNLATNAAYAMRQHGGVLEIKMSAVSVSEESVQQLPGLTPGSYIEVTVSDTGEGMLPEVIDRVFEPFFTTKPVGEGTGLGLSVVHGIVKSHEGAVFVESEAGRGTTFRIYLPAANQVMVTPASDRGFPSGGGELVLFVDDERSICRVAELLLHRIGYKARTFELPADALAEFKQNPQRYAAVMTDLTMPGMTGITLAQEIKKTAPQMPVILTTGFSGKLSNEGLEAYGADALLAKPFNLPELANCLSAVLGKAVGKMENSSD